MNRSNFNKVQNTNNKIMNRKSEIAQELSVIMPKVARRLLHEFIQHVEIPQAQLFSLIALDDKGPCRFSDLREELNISAPTVTGIVDRLEKSGYAKRIPDKEDRRAINIVLTNKGQKITKQLRETLKDRWKLFLGNLNNSEQEEYLRIIKKMQGV
ncbi:MAG: hypothetical protein A2Y03_03605 [Omnitrophica WOR_2 bacterium GWF2_38_59]|nr:MAG: hypothetical protein A2Y06_06630 [Omnitrophica WOR_2 bacterium GWA2_37_7]OGX23460.1 MAG: hypothetical protein A2Y03_03605 [Omnitrophica WOR_2 bacterium GWF2_38_59]OGX47131.1 MAG: hypothetical protein A2243_04745 [Omnitrophica WOR_2 bacterium RIFOXYA2_FULL_38_17]OGX51071.1 MAG: hypothetical protein A2267_00405 [Omnitrophica WOR_2 bacterium RIFOXYA12_FULL_38_10]OGX57115.1 MAG: hypothetical protein A2306_00975 [Omnitrophica WOR_2 bacterium RIFOXYB2_FULL_38_16]OGX59436.1 MAG: hypothetical 